MQTKDEKICHSCAGESNEEGSLWKQKKILTIVVSGVILATGLYFEFFIGQRFIAQGLFLAVVIVSGYDIIKKGIHSALKKRLDINTLMTIAATGAFLIGQGEEGASVIFLFFIAEFLEDYAAERARSSIASLLKLAPETATIKRNGKEATVHVHEIKAGDTIVVKPGDRIPIDGIVAKGASSVNQSAITGESMPVVKTKGSEVYAGTINEEGYLEIMADKKSDETVLSKIIKLVEEAQHQKSKTEVFIDRFARYYTPIVILIAFLVATVPVIVFNLPFNEWFYRALVLLVVSCPCALAISTPASMVSGITSAARNGVLIKGGNHIEEIRNTKAVVFDKTGTLTEGRPEVTDIIALNKYSEKELLWIAATLESKSKHPIAEAILKSVERKNIGIAKLSGFESFAGKGLRGKINGKTFYVGSRSFFKDIKIDAPKDVAEKLENEGKTAVLVGNSDHIIGIVALADKIRDTSFDTIRKLKNRGIKTIMLTGDNGKAAKAVAEKLEIDAYYAELMPQDKVAIIGKLSEKYGHVAMIGDGVNDAPVLGKASTGIAMGAVSSDAAIESADIVLMQDDLSKVGYLLDLSKETMSVVKQNIFVSILVKSFFAVLTLFWFVPLWLAVAVGDMGLSLAVTLNALKISRIKPK